jgi:hypothetical protein
VQALLLRPLLLPPPLRLLTLLLPAALLLPWCPWLLLRPVARPQAQRSS